MASYRAEYLGLVTRTRLAQMLTNTYAKLKNVDPDESYARLEDSLRDLRLIEGLQDAIWRALQAKRPNLTPEQLVARASKTLGRRKVFKPLRIRAADEGPWAALTVLIEFNAGFATGEAVGLLDTPDGEVLLQTGFDVCGRLLAQEMLP